MALILRNKNLTTKFQILVQIAANQPDIQQKDVARKLDITPQAVSEYIKEMMKDGSLTSEGRSRYRVTTEGVNWVIKELRKLRGYFDFVERAISNITVSAAVAERDLFRGQVVGLEMKDGLLFATNALGKAVKGVTVDSARKGEDVGVSNIQGIIEFEIGKITVLKVPSIQRGGYRNVDLERLKKKLDKKKLVGAIGIEALITLRRICVEPHYFYGVTEAVIEAAQSGLSSVILCSDDAIPDLLERLEAENLNYQLSELSADSELE